MRVLLEHVFDLHPYDAEGDPDRVAHHDPGACAMDLGRAEIFEPCDLRLDVVGLDVEVRTRRVVASALHHKDDAGRHLTEPVVLRKLGALLRRPPERSGPELDSAGAVGFRYVDKDRRETTAVSHARTVAWTS